MKYNLEPMPGIFRVAMKKDENLLFSVNNPEVYKAPGNDMYIIFGEVRVEDLNQMNQLQQEAAKKFEAPEEPKAEEKAEEKTEEKAEEGEKAAEQEEAVDETGLSADDIKFVMDSASVSRAVAVKALHENNGDMVNAVMSLQK